jgi:hypothetical protein
MLHTVCTEALGWGFTLNNNSKYNVLILWWLAYGSSMARMSRSCPSLACHHASRTPTDGTRAEWGGGQVKVGNPFSLSPHMYSFTTARCRVQTTLGSMQLHFYNKEQKHLPLLHPQAFNLLVSLGIFKLVRPQQQHISIRILCYI